MTELRQIDIVQTLFGELTHNYDEKIKQIKVYEDPMDKEIYFLVTDVVKYINSNSNNLHAFKKKFRSPQEICKKVVLIPQKRGTNKNSTSLKECNFLTRSGMIRAAGFCKNNNTASVCFREFINAISDSININLIDIVPTLINYHENMTEPHIQEEIAEISEASIGIVYFIQDVARGYTKIGRTCSPVEERLKNLQTGNPDELTIYKVITCTDILPSCNLEKLLHDKFHDYHIRGEWYNITNVQIDTCHVDI